MKFVLFIILSSTLFGCYNKTSEKKEALNFAKQITQNHFNKDCNIFYNFLSDTLILINPFISIEKSKKLDFKIPLNLAIENKDKYCTYYTKRNLTKNGYTFQEYLNDYNLNVYSVNEFTDKEYMKEMGEDESLFMFFYHLKRLYSEKDYFVSGYYLKDKKSTHKIKTSRAWQFVISKVNNEWKITGVILN